MDRHPLFFEIALDDLALPSDFQQAADGPLHHFLVLIHALEERPGALGEEEQFFCGRREALVLGLVEEVPLDQLLDVFFAEMVGVDFALQQQLQQLAADLQLVHLVDSSAGESLPSPEAGFLELQHEEVEEALAFQPQLPDEVEPVDVDGLEGAQAGQRLAEVRDFLAERVVVLPGEVLDDREEDVVVAGYDVEGPRPETGREWKLEQFEGG